ncbi:MAG TPA: UDP-N-acetylglucosamine 2-epimerase (non-hydrolyzing) [Gemmataceae bacterium]|jgi:UDP-GlcNAc3NAcA epimerase|nr:UDP-N-acetylglucosamine 2-epimerase (non-hydrolyzing) [Gemmataceae bacterium]
MKIVTVIGARPQFIKAAAVSRLLRTAPDTREVTVHTGQHYDENMSDVFFQELGIPKPDYHLGVGSGSHGAMTGRMLEKIESVLVAERPDALLVYGDTNSTLAGALAAAKMHIRVAHVEAGLRSFNQRMPEEINRVLTDHVSKWLFCPTPVAVENLAREGIADARVALVGDVMYDVTLAVRDRAASVERFGVKPGGYILATIHRAENTDVPVRLAAVFDALRQVARETPVVLPLHPRTRAVLAKAGKPADADGLKIIDPVGYLDMTSLERHARLVVTDSGGVQKEAFFHRVPCVTLRDETEWVELVTLGWNRIVPPVSAAAVRDGVRAALAGGPGQDPPADLYGGGRAAERIVAALSPS